MIIITCQIELNLPGVASLKEKRSIIKSVVKRLQREFNLATAEIGHLDVWQSSQIGLVTIGNDAGHLQSQLEKAVAWLERNRPDVYIVDYTIEFR